MDESFERPYHCVRNWAKTRVYTISLFPYHTRIPSRDWLSKCTRKLLTISFHFLSIIVRKIIGSKCKRGKKCTENQLIHLELWFWVCFACSCIGSVSNRGFFFFFLHLFWFHTSTVFGAPNNILANRGDDHHNIEDQHWNFHWPNW